jgi:hypothetical protein
MEKDTGESSTRQRVYGAWQVQINGDDMRTGGGRVIVNAASNLRQIVTVFVSERIVCEANRAVVFLVGRLGQNGRVSASRLPNNLF